MKEKAINNGWISILPDGSNLPKEAGAYWTISESSKEPSANTWGIFNSNTWTFNHEPITHYQPIIKPEKPLY